MPADKVHENIWRWVTVLLTTVVIAVAAGLVANATPSRFVSAASVLVGPVTADVDTLRAAESLTATYSQLLLRPEALQEVATFVRVSPADVADASEVTFNTDTRIVTLTVTTGTASESQRIASSLTAQLTQLVGTIDPTAPGAVQILSVQPQTAQAVNRSPLRYALLAGAGWFLLAIGVLAAFATRPARSSPQPVGLAPMAALGTAGSSASRLTSADADLIADQVANRLVQSMRVDERGAGQG